MIIQRRSYYLAVSANAPAGPEESSRSLAPRWPNGRFTGQGEPIPSRTASVRARLREMMAEETTDEDGKTLRWSERIALGLAKRAATGHPQAVQILIEQVDGPIPRTEADGDYRVTIQYVHQQINLPAAVPALEPEAE